MTKQIENKEKGNVPECFVIMPIADSEGYTTGHFTKVYEDIFKPACTSAGYKPIRADEVTQTNLIHLDILQKLIESPMAICDLSSRNPNVLFELGLRQAFDKPTVLVQEVGTPKIFDIAPLRYTEYRKELGYRDVLKDQASISEAIRSTQSATDKGEGINSIIRILSLSRPATLKETQEGDASGLLHLIRAEMSEMRSDFRSAILTIEKNKPIGFIEENKKYSNRIIKDVMAQFNETRELIKMKFPSDLIITGINNTRKSLMRLLDTEISINTREEVLNLLKQCDELELATIL
ncbi:MAG: hypothetical protein V4732_22185 [Pseudomonadota bacterium]